jgi:hypothetical protein
LLDVIDEGLLDFALAMWVGGAQETEYIGILEEVDRHVGFGRGERSLEIVESLAVALVCSAGDLKLEDVPAPAMLQCLPGIPGSCFVITEAFEQGDILSPRQLCNDPLHKLRLGPGSRESSHVLEVTRREPFHVGVRLA